MIVSRYVSNTNLDYNNVNNVNNVNNINNVNDINNVNNVNHTVTQLIGTPKL